MAMEPEYVQDYTPVSATRCWKKRLPRYKAALLLLVLILTVLLILLVIGLSLSRDRRRGHVTRFYPYTVTYQFGAVQAPSATCAEVGVVLQTVHAGSAVDAAIATTLCAGVVAWGNGGLGGSLVATVFDKTNSSTPQQVAVVAQGTAPLLANRNMFLNHPDHQASTRGGLSITVPGQVAGLYALWERHGTLPWADLVRPSILLVQYMMESNSTSPPPSPDGPTDSTPTYTGDFTANLPGLLKTLTVVSADPSSFYQGQLARDIVEDIQDAGGIVSLQDLATYRPVIEPAVSLSLPTVNLSLLTTPAPSGGPFVNYVMSRMDEYHGNRSKMAATLGEVYTELVTVVRAAFSALLRWDTVHEKDLTWINPKRASHDQQDQLTSEDDVSNDVIVMDRHGSCVIITSTLNSRFGSRVVGQRTGILFNNAMSTFSVVRHPEDFDRTWHNHHIAPRAMSRSPMAPTLLVDSTGCQVVWGAAGGAPTSSLTGLVQVLHRWLYERETLERAVGLPRLHFDPKSGEVLYEDGFDWSIQEELQQRAFRGDGAAPYRPAPYRTAPTPCLHPHHPAHWAGGWWARTDITAVMDTRHDVMDRQHDVTDARRDVTNDVSHDAVSSEQEEFLYDVNSNRLRDVLGDGQSDVIDHDEYDVIVDDTRDVICHEHIAVVIDGY